MNKSHDYLAEEDSIRAGVRIASLSFSLHYDATEIAALVSKTRALTAMERDNARETIRLLSGIIETEQMEAA